MQNIPNYQGTKQYTYKYPMGQKNNGTQKIFRTIYKNLWMLTKAMLERMYSSKCLYSKNI